MRAQAPDTTTGPEGDGPSPAALEWILSSHPGSRERLETDPALRASLLAVVSASPWLARVCASDPQALDALADLERPELPTEPVPGGPFEHLRRMKDLGILRIAARDLLDLDSVETVGHRLSGLAEKLLAESLALTAGPAGPLGGDRQPGGGGPTGLAVIALGKLGAGELNYSSDIDLVLVAAGPGGGDHGGDVHTGADRGGDGHVGVHGGGVHGGPEPRAFVEMARAAWRIDLGLRPEGRSGPLARTLDSYDAYWSRWAEPWEFQALLKARPVAGDAELGRAFATRSAAHVWGRSFGADEIRQVRRLKSRSESDLARRNLAEREIKRGPGGIRDIEFSVQLLQLVHGRRDPALRTPATLDALDALAAGGYVGPEDAAALADAYRFLRRVEHRLQLYEGQQVHTLPRGAERRSQLAQVMGYRHDGNLSAEQRFDDDLRYHRATARSIHQRLFFRPLLEVFSSPKAALSSEAAAERLAAFGFADPARTAQAVSELTRGFSRASQLMQSMLPLLLDWLSGSPDPDQGLLGLRVLAAGTQSRDRLVAVCRESPAGARQLCHLLGTAPRFARDLQRHPESLTGLASGDFPGTCGDDELHERASRSIKWRSGEGSIELGLRQFAQAEKLRIASRDVLGMESFDGVGAALTDLADSVVTAAVDHLEPGVPLAVIGMGRLGGRELTYTSDLDLLLVWDAPGAPPAEAAVTAEATAAALTRLVGGASPATGAYPVDLGLRPEGRQGPPARSLDAYTAYYGRWAEPWERQALLRSRYVAGDRGVADRFARLVDGFVWGSALTADDIRAIRRSKARMERERVPAGDDPKFHLKLGPGSMSDVEWTVQLLQLGHSVRGTGTMEVLDELLAVGAIAADDAAVLQEAYRFCGRARNRLSLIRDVPSDSLPVTGPVLSTLARSLGLTPTGLRNEYTRVTRRARRVMEAVFYGS